MINDDVRQKKIYEIMQKLLHILRFPSTFFPQFNISCNLTLNDFKSKSYFLLPQQQPAAATGKTPQHSSNFISHNSLVFKSLFSQYLSLSVCLYEIWFRNGEENPMTNQIAIKNNLFDVNLAGLLFNRHELKEGKEEFTRCGHLKSDKQKMPNGD